MKRTKLAANPLDKRWDGEVCHRGLKGNKILVMGWSDAVAAYPGMGLNWERWLVALAFAYIGRASGRHPNPYPHAV
jgi:hypothetical protein